MRKFARSCVLAVAVAADLAVTVALAEQYGKNNICINAINQIGRAHV